MLTYDDIKSFSTLSKISMTMYDFFLFFFFEGFSSVRSQGSEARISNKIAMGKHHSIILSFYYSATLCVVVPLCACVSLSHCLSLSLTLCVCLSLSVSQFCLFLSHSFSQFAFFPLTFLLFSFVHNFVFVVCCLCC